jgi:hypothetical protein
MSTTTPQRRPLLLLPHAADWLRRIHVHADRLEAWLLDQLLEQLRLRYRRVMRPQGAT